MPKNVKTKRLSTESMSIHTIDSESDSQPNSK